jgi:putative hydrolase of the HAD superfamily
MSRPPLRALLLDLGNVLVLHDNEKLFRALAAAFGCDAETVRDHLDAGLWDAVNRGLLPGDALRRELVRRIGRDLEPGRWLELWSCHFEVNEPMVCAVERRLGRERLVLVSNTHDQHVAWIRPRLPLLERFDGLVLSCEVGLAKPDPAIFEKALAVAGVRAEEAAFFDDVPAYVTAAAALGLHARLFTTAARFEQDLDALVAPGAIPVAEARAR